VNGPSASSCLRPSKRSSRHDLAPIGGGVRFGSANSVAILSQSATTSPWRGNFFPKSCPFHQGHYAKVVPNKRVWVPTCHLHGPRLTLLCLPFLAPPSYLAPYFAPRWLSAWLSPSFSPSTIPAKFGIESAFPATLAVGFVVGEFSPRSLHV